MTDACAHVRRSTSTSVDWESKVNPLTGDMENWRQVDTVTTSCDDCPTQLTVRTVYHPPRF